MGAVEDAFTGLRAMIGAGELAPGQRLPAEGPLCAQLGVSRGSLREAVRMLGALGVLESRHGAGTFVSALGAAEILGALRLTVDLMPVDVLLEVYELRRVLESHAAAQAAARVDEATLGELGAILDALELAAGEEASELDARFHGTIARAAGNEALATTLEVFRTRSRDYQLFDLPQGEAIKQESDLGHRRILRGIRDRDPNGAAQAAGAHVAQTERWLRELRPQPRPRTD